MLLPLQPLFKKVANLLKLFEVASTNYKISEKYGFYQQCHDCSPWAIGALS